MVEFPIASLSFLASTDGATVATAAVIVGPVIAVVAIVMGTIQKIETTKAREQTRREIAAYVAEGSISPEEGRRLIEAGRKPGEKPGEVESA